MPNEPPEEGVRRDSLPLERLLASLGPRMNMLALVLPLGALGGYFATPGANLEQKIAFLMHYAETLLKLSP